MFLLKWSPKIEIFLLIKVDQETRSVQFNYTIAKTRSEITTVCQSWFPHGLEKWEHIFQSGKNQEILNRLERSGNFTQNTGK